MEKKNIYFVIGIIIIAFLLFQGSKKLGGGFLSPPPQPTEVWQQEYRDALLMNSININYTRAQVVIDYITPEIQAEIDKMDAGSPEDAIKKATRFVLDKVDYNSAGITPTYCYNEKASDVLRIGNGDCVSMVKLGTAILRGQGIAVRTIGGCVKLSGGCTPLMGVIPLPFVEKAAIYDGKKRGYLHEWTEVWLPTKGWILVDFTNGAIYEKGCDDYLFYSYDEGDYKDICVINDRSFIDNCMKA